ncbi:MAG: YkgJ family cysteine cluster protein [Deltaproteobacteria bacterium]|nr:YkgJ family cysteine cluster protein [Deltaproteobacteria bacterium]MBW1921092.1 YkgJ family cysteine cluster protein [Deltaproteobacteria bacterium]MBW1935670.1 YkgJ family cysteine cluster protein [Deltaproteobacteria bacterium]MBW1977957.1 YkgJ family cysteine cluster protein [Deltaproteobacteria bacterium]MBW2301058.1 YkgJ family cysteine cluster protein [Deltaproteobacteria bacterium]
MTQSKKESVFRPIEGNKFKFLCHKEVPCFTKCCANLNLVLTPYDIVRMKTRLGISSEDFLEQYTSISFDRHPRFPMVFLKMNNDREKTCPFVTREGCSIYEDRPSACRIYPLGRASLWLPRHSRTKEDFFLVQETHCLGFQEDRVWTVQQWMADQGLEEYNKMNDEWLEILDFPRELGSKNEISLKIQMFYIGSYNLDKLRELIFKSKFFHLFELDNDLKTRLEADDVALLKFSFDWLKFSLFGEKTIQVRRYGSHSIPG